MEADEAYAVKYLSSECIELDSVVIYSGGIMSFEVDDDGCREYSSCATFELRKENGIESLELRWARTNKEIDTVTLADLPSDTLAAKVISRIDTDDIDERFFDEELRGRAMFEIDKFIAASRLMNTR